MDEQEFRVSLSERLAKIETQIQYIQQSIDYIRQFGERLAAVDSRSKSNTHRLDSIDEREKERDRRAMQKAAIMATIVSAIISAGVALLR